MRIILDAMGGDNAPQAPVIGALQAAKDFGAQIILVGRGEEILSVMRSQGYNDLPEGIEIAHADEVVDMHDDPANVIRKKKNSSMVIGLKMLADGQGDAFVSAGSTGALLTGATLLVKRGDGRPLRLAEVLTSGAPRRRITSWQKPWSGTRMPSVPSAAGRLAATQSPSKGCHRSRGRM